MSRRVWERYDSDDSDVYSDDGEDYLPASNHPGGSLAAGSGAGEFECVTCNISFRTSKELKSHKIKDSEKHEYCVPCDRDFDSNKELKMHLIKSPLHMVCVDCFKEFKSKGGLEGHRKQMHRVSQKIRCPGCGAFFQNASGITQHIESDECTEGLDKATLARRIIDAHDPTARLDIDPRQKPDTTTTHIWRDGIVTPALKAQIEQESSQSGSAPRDPRIPLPEWNKYQNSPSVAGSMQSGGSGSGGADNRARPGPSVLDYTDGIGADDDQPVYTLADMGKYWHNDQRQFLCPHNTCRKKFKKAGAILQHMSSTAHARKVFRCPTCCDRYKSSSALLQHMESGSCRINQTSHFGEATNTLTGGLIFPM